MHRLGCSRRREDPAIMLQQLQQATLSPLVQAGLLGHAVSAAALALRARSLRAPRGALGVARLPFEPEAEEGARRAREAQAHEEDAAYLTYLLITNLKNWRERRDGVPPGQVARIDGLSPAVSDALMKQVGAVEIVNAKGDMKGSAISGPVAKECADLWPRIASAAGTVL